MYVAIEVLKVLVKLLEMKLAIAYVSNKTLHWSDLVRDSEQISSR